MAEKQSQLIVASCDRRTPYAATGAKQTPPAIERRGDRVVDAALEWLKLNPRRPFFLWVHLYDPHAPYKPPEPYASRYLGHPYDGEIAFADASRLLGLNRPFPTVEPPSLLTTRRNG